MLIFLLKVWHKLIVSDKEKNACSEKLCLTGVLVLCNPNFLNNEIKEIKYVHCCITAIFFPLLVLFLGNKVNELYSEVIFLHNEMFCLQ